MDELKPCPFCGGAAKIHKLSFYISAFYAQCDCCRVETDCEDSEEEAANVWNSRVVGNTKMPMGSMTYAIACRICKNRDSDKCAACKMEIQSGFELDEDAFKEALVDG